MSFSEELRRININLLEIAFSEHVVPHREVHSVLQECRNLDTTALCLSGGGIRSATFNLGILQGLARKGVLKDVDYLSTVSGGGYIGGWLSSWMRRHDEGAGGVFRDLAHSTDDPLEPEVKPVRHLREYSDYLAPRYGMFSADTWTLVGTFLRNLLLNWSLLVPLIAVVLMVPRLFEALLLHSPRVIPNAGIAGVAIAFLVVTMIQVGRLRPARSYIPGSAPTNAEIREKQREIWRWLGPGLIATFLFAVYWGRQTEPPVAIDLFRTILFVLLGVNIIGAGVFIVAYLRCEVSLETASTLRDRIKRIWRVGRNLLAGGRIRWKVRLELLGVTAAAIAGAVLLTAAAIQFSNPTGHAQVHGLSCPEWFTLFGIPSVLLVFFVEATVLIGAVTKVSSDHEREWWARSAAWLFIISLGWLTLSAATIVGPLLILQLPKIMISTSIISGLGTLILGRSSRTPGRSRGEDTATGKGRRVALGFVATIFLVIVLGAISLAISAVTANIEGRAFKSASSITTPAALTLLHTTGAETTTFKVAVESKTNVLDATRASVWHIVELRSADPLLLLVLVVLLAGVVACASRFLDTNVFSMHGMYRNRLIRAYLGASRWERRPDPFTGFDPQDNLQMYELRPEMLWLSSFRNFDGFVEHMKKRNRFVWWHLPKTMRHKVDQYLGTANRERDLLRRDMAGELLSEINYIMLCFDLETKTRAVTSLELLQHNAATMRRDYGEFLRCDHENSVPLHIVNMTLNLVSGEKLAWRNRKAASFTVTSLHAGNRRLGYRDSAEYGGPRGMSLGTAMAISGAAVSPNRGYSSSPIITFLLTLFNARLGWWLGNPGEKGYGTYRQRCPKDSLQTLVAEAIGNTHDESEYVFLSDGGHFDNLGLYEAVLRRARRIIVCDATADGKYAFGDLANAVRKIRIDLGVPIHFETMYIGPTDARDNVGKYCALGGILYSCIDNPQPGQYGYRENFDGNLIYIKPAVYRDCPTDVSNYKKQHAGFPHETTVDQFFSETQFESYRALGSHVIDEICRNRSTKNMISKDFFYEAYKYLHDAAARKLAAVDDVVRA